MPRTLLSRTLLSRWLGAPAIGAILSIAHDARAADVPAPSASAAPVPSPAAAPPSTPSAPPAVLVPPPPPPWPAPAIATARAPSPRPLSDRCPAPAGADAKIADLAVRDRIAFIRRVMDRDGARARMWSWGWGLGFTAVAAANITLGAITDDVAARRSFLIAGFPALLTPIGVLVLPHRVMGASRELDERLDRAPAGEDPCLTLRDAETLFVDSADNERAKAGPLSHVAVVVVNAAILLTLGLGFDQWTDGAIDSAVGFVLGEASVLTMPTALARDRDAYFTGAIGSNARATPFVRVGSVGLAAPRALTMPPPAPGVIVGVSF